MGANRIDVDYYQSRSSHENRNSFQLILVDRSDIADGDFDIVFNYDQIQRETGTAGDGNASGLGGKSARAGYFNGTRESGTFFELDGSAINGARLDNGPLSTSLIHNSVNSDIDGRYIFGARSGTVTDNIGGPANDVPEPSSLAVLLMGPITLVPLWVRRQRRALQARVPALRFHDDCRQTRRPRRRSPLFVSPDACRRSRLCPGDASRRQATVR